MADPLMTMRAYARSRDLSPSTISRQVRDGLIPTHGEKRLIDPEEADRIRAENLHPGLKKGSIANPKPQESEEEETVTPDEDAEWKAQWEYRGQVGEMVPVKEVERLLGLVIETEHDRYQLAALTIADRVRQVVEEEMRTFIAPIEELLRGASEDDDD